jgi:hypothetical protein
MAKPIELKGALGVRNDISPERFSPKDLLIGSNIELDDTGKVARRLGTTPLIPGDAHSLYASGDDCLAVVNGVLNRINPDNSLVPLLSVGAGRVAYQRIVDEVMWSNGSQSGIVSRAGARQWGITPPPAFAATSTSTGALREGDYLYTMTFVRADGKESGAPICGRLHAVGGINFANLPVSSDPLVTSKRIYLSAWDGELPYLAMSLMNTVKSATLSDDPPAGPPLRTQFMGAAPAGQLVGYYNGRAYVAQGRFLWYSQPYEFELFDLMNSYLAFPSEVKTFAPVSDGVFVGSEDETVFLHGDDPAEFKRRQVADYGTVLGTEQEIPEYYVLDEKQRNLGPQVMWMSKQGVCLGSNGGHYKNLTGGRYILPGGVVTGASLLKVRGGTPQLVVSLFR